MLDTWNALSLGLFDTLLGWLLELPRPVGLVVVGLATAGLLALIRKGTTNQDRLARAAADLRRLKELANAAKQSRDSDALARIKQTRGRIGLIKLKAEGWPLVAMLVPLALMATWAFERIAYSPPAAGQSVEIVLHLRSGSGPALTAKDDLLHLVPQAGLRAQNGWVQPVRIERDSPTRWDRFWAKMTFSAVHEAEPDLVAIWRLQGDAHDEAYHLVFRWKDRTFERDLLIGQRSYSPVLDERPDEPVIFEIRLQETRLFGIPGLSVWLPAWLVGYLIVTIPFVLVLKRLFRIY